MNISVYIVIGGKMSPNSEIAAIIETCVDLVGSHNSVRLGISMRGDGKFVRNDQIIDNVEVLKELYNFIHLTNDVIDKLRILDRNILQYDPDSI